MTNQNDQYALSGRTILVTRARHQAGRLAEALRARGAMVLEIPAIAIEPPPSYAALDAALRDIAACDWLIVTSANGVEALRGRMTEMDIAAEAFGNVQVAAVGSATAAALHAMGLHVALTPKEYVAESLVEELGDRAAGQRVLLVRAIVARDVIPDALRRRGATVDVVDAYRTVIPAESVTAVRTILGAGGHAPDAATFTSSSTVTNFTALLREAGVALPLGMKAISIGPVTSATLREIGWEPAAEADPHDLQGLVAAVVRAL
ncbi:MAG TPA: uroporphyrinogen-III synthase [Acidobacteriaceae bacterium]|nr:uroporphyrinogen-III synthase [Acidobacteriaceae bacterium]